MVIGLDDDALVRHRHGVHAQASSRYAFNFVTTPFTMRAIVACLPFSSLLVFAPHTQAQTLQEHWWHPNGRVNTIAYSEELDRVYIGGQFTHVGPNVPYGAQLDEGTASYNPSFAKPDGRVRACIADGAGGWFIGGDFTHVGGVSRNRVARINADGSLHAWDPNASGSVRSLCSLGNTVFIGGSFYMVGGQTRNGIAAVDASTGAVSGWYPGACLSVYSIVLGGDTLYLGGSFNMIGSQTRLGLAAVDATTGTLFGWAPNPGTVNALALNGGTIYVGGTFGSISGQSRNRIAEVDRTTGLATAWNPNASSDVHALAVDGATIYVGGNFSTIGGQSRFRIAAINASTGQATSWNPGATGSVRALAVNASTVYAAGILSSIGGQARNHIAALDRTTGTATTWDPVAGDTVLCMALQNNAVYVGGCFTNMNCVARGSLAALDASTGELAPGTPSVNSTLAQVIALAVKDSIVYVGGSFNGAFGGQSRSYIAAFNANTGVVTPWAPQANSNVMALAVNANTVFAGGAFTTIGGQTRQNIAALDRSTGLATPWMSSANNYVNGLLLHGPLLYVHGPFTQLGAQTRYEVGALDTLSGALASWAPNAAPATAVNAFTPGGSGTVFLAGNFQNMGGQPRYAVAEVGSTTGTATAWVQPTTPGTLNALATRGTRVFIAGSFFLLGGQPHRSVAALDRNTGALDPWDPDVDLPVYSLGISDTLLFVGGDFKRVGTNGRHGFAVYGLCGEHVYYQDGDGDGHGSPMTSTVACGPVPTGYAVDPDDCDDADLSVWVGAVCTTDLGGEGVITNDCICVGSTGLPAKPQVQTLRAGPSPFDQIVFLQGAATGMLRIVVLDQAARVVHAEQTRSNGAYKHTLELGALASGCYTVQVHSDDGVEAVRIVRR